MRAGSFSPNTIKGNHLDGRRISEQEPFSNQSRSQQSGDSTRRDQKRSVIRIRGIIEVTDPFMKPAFREHRSDGKFQPEPYPEEHPQERIEKYAPTSQSEEQERV